MNNGELKENQFFLYFSSARLKSSENKAKSPPLVDPRTDYLPAAFIFPLDPQCQNKTILLQHSNQNILKSKQLFKIHIPIKSRLTKI